ncbi:hypothetical protein HMPREF2141_01650 [Bacteroides uniformis]|nr:hypothetical protein HMPREF2141_01650 [Bacteroides uniformis]KXT43426.1 hypothetical protein HMPREF2532_03922 [Bacteroides ovatus]
MNRTAGNSGMILCTYHGNYHCFIFHILGFLALRVIFSAD